MLAGHLGGEGQVDLVVAVDQCGRQVAAGGGELLSDRVGGASVVGVCVGHVGISEGETNTLTGLGRQAGRDG